MPQTLPLLEAGADLDLAESVAFAQGGQESRLSYAFESKELATTVNPFYANSLGSWFKSSLRLGVEEPTTKYVAGALSVSESTRSTRSELRTPRLEWPTAPHPALTISVRRLLGTLWAIVVSRALQVGFPLRSTTVSIFEDPNEQEHKAVLRLACDANAVQALAFWDSLEPDLQNWLGTLSHNDRTTFITRLGLRVHWR